MTMYDQVCIKPLQSFLKPNPNWWSYGHFLGNLGQNTQPKNTPKVCPSDMNHQASVLVRRPVAGCSSLGFFNERLATWERTRFERKRWRHWKSLLYLLDDIDYDVIMIIIHMYHDSINDSFKSRIILVLTCPHGTSRLDMWGRHQILRNGPPIALQQWRNIDHSKPRQLQERVDNWSAENSCGSMWVVNEFSLVFFGAKTRSSRV